MRSRLRVFGETVDKLEADGDLMGRQLAELEEAKSQAEFQMRNQVRQVEVKAAGLEDQLQRAKSMLEEEEAKGEDMAIKLRSSIREFEMGKSRLVEVERECALRVSEVQIEKAKEMSGLKQQMVVLEHRAIDAESRVYACDKEMAEMAVKQREEMERLEIDFVRERREFAEEIQRQEELKAELVAKMKSMAMRIEEVEEERQNYRQERNRMLRGFDEDIRAVATEREVMRRELEHLKGEMDQGIKQKYSKGKKYKTPHEDSGSDSSTELATKCRRYSKLIHKLRDKLALTQVGDPNDNSSIFQGGRREAATGEGGHGRLCQP